MGDDGLRYPAFDSPIANNGYRWWYVDALSDDGAYGLAIIALLGNPFSPFYARRRRQVAEVDPLDFNAMNVVLYRRGGGGRWWNRSSKRWCFSEYSAEHLDRGADHLGLGPNHFDWDGQRLKIIADERSPILRAKIRGEIELRPGQRFDTSVNLDGQGRHYWWPIAPQSRIRVTLTHPQLSFEGKAYHDSNWGSEPLADGFSGWNWSRSSVDGGTAILYDTRSLQGTERRFARFFSADGTVWDLDLAQIVDLGRSRWGIARQTRSHADDTPRLVQSLENSPFYTRALLRWSLQGAPAEGVHESMNLQRFRRSWVQFLFYLRMRRAVSGSAGARLGLWARLRS